MRQFWMTLLMASLFGLTACAGTMQSDANAPTVSYSYDDEDEYEEVAALADDYCDDNYDRDAVLVDQDEDGDDNEAIFACE